MTKRVFVPTQKYIPGTSLETQVSRWEWQKGKGLWVHFKDGATREGYEVRVQEIS